ncbi:hypothetical protein R3P38DRAFT_2905563 [Favolaschia claudopus]|uniref:N-acetyltransferase domain-containing protein n=1 Tax=Favolaschia claudopus TaxID=2862362 RepID=A0AAW0CHG9_9AGAR
MAVTLDPAHPSYRRTLDGGRLTLRWSTVEDKAGCILLSCLAAGEQEGEETERMMRFLEPHTDDSFYAGSSADWAVCVETPSTPPTSTTNTSTQDSYGNQVRNAAETAPEKVVALVYYLPGEIAFDSDAVRLPYGCAHIVACKKAYRGRTGDESIIHALFAMINARAVADGCPLFVMPGIPSYYRMHGYEYALDMGLGLLTHAAALTKAPEASSPYLLRRATLDDVPALDRMVLAPRSEADIFIGAKDAETLTAQLRYILGDCSAAYASRTDYPLEPVFVLEKEIGGGTDTCTATPSHVVVAAARLRRPRQGDSSTVVHPLLWDGEEDASAVACAIAKGLVKQAGEVLPGRDPNFETKITTLRWMLPDAHPLYQWLVAHELAVPLPETSRYNMMHVWWISIPSLSRFLTALLPALNKRLDASRHIFGANYAATLHVGASRSMGGGVVMRVVDSVIVEVDAPKPNSPKPNLTLPQGALIQLMMGYKGWRELKEVYPDVAVEPAVVPLVDVLFPKRRVWAGLYT